MNETLDDRSYSHPDSRILSVFLMYKLISDYITNTKIFRVLDGILGCSRTIFLCPSSTIKTFYLLSEQHEMVGINTHNSSTAKPANIPL